MDVFLDRCQTSHGWALFLVGVQLQQGSGICTFLCPEVTITFYVECCPNGIDPEILKKKNMGKAFPLWRAKEKKHKSFRQTTIDPVN